MDERRPAVSFWPGEYLQDELVARGWRAEQFAFMLGVPAATITNFINGYRPMTTELADLVGEGTATDPATWMRLQEIWDRRDERTAAVAEYVEYLKANPPELD